MPVVQEVKASRPVKSRRVHYISGFDPRGARYYHRLYREEAAKQAIHLGTALEVGDRRRVSSTVNAWTVKGVWHGQPVTTDYQFMVWDDIARRNWEAGLFKLFLRGVHYYIHYTADGAFPRILKVAKGAGHTALYPLRFFWVACILIAVAALAGAGLAWGLAGSWLLSLGVAVVIALALGWKARQIAEQWDVLWVLRTCVFVYGWGTRPPDGLEERINEMATHIAREQEANPVDEVLIIGHSVGSIVATAVTARILEKNKTAKFPPGLHLLTLGQCIPYLSFIPSARAFRHDLETIGNDARIPWTDATSPPDPLCFYQVDPLQVSGITAGVENRSKRIGVRIAKMFKPETYAQVRRSKRRIHFQYLMASELPADYDYFRITAGPSSLLSPD